MTKQNPQQEAQIPPSGRRLVRRWRAPAAACGLLACGLLAGCGAAGAAAGTDTGAASQGQSITLYSGQQDRKSVV